MARSGNKVIRLLLKIFLWVIGIYILLIIVASPLARYLIQKHDVRYTGREITLQRAIVNPIGGSVSLRNLKLYEAENDSVFISFGRLSANMSMLKMLTGVYQVNSIRLVDPRIDIFRDDTIFNFTDLIERFAVKEDSLEEETLKLNFGEIEIKNGLITYGEAEIKTGTEISEINFFSPGKKWNDDIIEGEYSFKPGSGRAEGNFTINLKTFDYNAGFRLTAFNPGVFIEYLEKYAVKASLRGNINIDLISEGNFNEPLNGRAQGNIEIKNFHFGKDSLNDYASFDRLLVEMREVDLKENKFYFDSILLNKPDILYQMYDTLDNFRRLLTPEIEEEAKEAADTVDYLVDILGADYNVRNFAITNGKIEFNDFSIAEKFTFLVNQFNITADSVDKQNKRLKVTTTASIIPSGDLNMVLHMDPKNEKNFDISYEFRDIPATMFNPYILTYTSYQLDRGTIEMHGTWNVRDNNISSLNHFLVVDPRDTKRVRGKDTRWVPLPLIMSVVRERGGVIDYQIPVKGNLKDPSFKLWDIITDIFRNILVKPPTTPYGIQVKNLEEEVQKTLAVKWRMRQVEIGKDQEKFVEGISDFLKDNPEAYITVEPVYHVEKEMENILLFEAKKKYFFESKGKKVTALERRDSMEVEKLSSRDPDFLAYIEKQANNPGMLTLQEKCYMYIGREHVQERFNELMESRKREFLSFFEKDKTMDRVEMKEPQNRVPYDWFSFFGINYKGDVPESLKEAYDQLYDLIESPRDDFPIRRR